MTKIIKPDDLDIEFYRQTNPALKSKTDEQIIKHYIRSKKNKINVKPDEKEKDKNVCLQNNPPVVQNNPPVVQNKPPVVQNKPLVVQNKPPVVQNKPPVVQNKTNEEVIKYDKCIHKKKILKPPDLDIELHRQTNPALKNKTDEQIIKHYFRSRKDKKNVEEEDKLDINMDINFYKKNNPVLQDKTDKQVIEHYMLYEKKEGRLINENTLEYIYANKSQILENPVNTQFYIFKCNDPLWSPYKLEETCINNNFKNIIVFDMKWMGGGAYNYLQNIIQKYKKNYNFIIVRETEDLNIYVSLNDEALLKRNITVNHVPNFINNIGYEFIFINSLATQSNDYIKMVDNINCCCKIGITHDFSILYKEVHPFILNLTQIRDELFYNLIITQDEMNNINMNLKTSITCKMPDYYHAGDRVNTKNDKINIAVIGAISNIKGKLFYEKMLNYFETNNLTYKYNFQIIGYSSGNILKNYSSPYYSITEFNEILIRYKPNIIIEASTTPESWSYTTTLAKTTRLPIVYLDKSFSSVIKNRLTKYYNKGYTFSNIQECLQLIDDKSQNYFYTIKNEMVFPRLYESIFSGNFTENIIVITSKIIVSSTAYSYTAQRSIYSTDERFMQTLDTINSIRKYFNNKYYKIILVDNSRLSEEQKITLKNNVDILLGRDDMEEIDKVDYETDIVINKGFGEAAQLNEANKYIKKHNLSFKNLFKISGRYLLNDNFNYEHFNNNKNNFKLAVEIIKNNPLINNYYYTSFFKISYNYFDKYKMSIELLLTNRYILSECINYEQELPNTIKYFSGAESFQYVNKLGLTQNISVWNKELYAEQLYV